MDTKVHALTLSISQSTGNVSGEIVEPLNMTALLVFAHGAGAGMMHPFMVQVSSGLAQLGIGSMRFNFPFIEQRKGRPDFPAVAEKVVETAISKAHELYPGVPLFASGKSFGGRMTSQHLSKHQHEYLQGIIFFGFPLHAPGKPSIDRAAHLNNIKIPMLFLQGTRDSLAEWSLIEQVCSGLPTATLARIENADHAFRSKGKDCIPLLTPEVAKWVHDRLESKPLT